MIFIWLFLFIWFFLHHIAHVSWCWLETIPERAARSKSCLINPKRYMVSFSHASSHTVLMWYSVVIWLAYLTFHRSQGSSVWASTLESGRGRKFSWSPPVRRQQVSGRRACSLSQITSSSCLPASKLKPPQLIIGSNACTWSWDSRMMAMCALWPLLETLLHSDYGWHTKR